MVIHPPPPPPPKVANKLVIYATGSIVLRGHYAADGTLKSPNQLTFNKNPTHSDKLSVQW